MSFTFILAMIYTMLLIIDIFALIIGIKSHEWALFIGVTSFTVIGTAVLAYLWFKCPM